MAKLIALSTTSAPNESTPVWKNESERMVSIATSHQNFIGVLFLKLKECFDASLFTLPNPKTLMYSGEDNINYYFRCGANLKLTIPKSLRLEGFTPRDIDTFLDTYSLEVNSMPISPESWKAFLLFPLEEVKKRAKKNTDTILGGSEKGPKDRSVRGRVGRVVDKLLPGDKHLPQVVGEPSTEEVSVSKNHISTPSKFPTITIK